MADIVRITLRLSTAQPEQKRALDIITQIPVGLRTGEICRMICGYRNQEQLIQEIRGMLKPNIFREAEPATEAVDQDVLGFLLSLQEEGGAADSIF